MLTEIKNIIYKGQRLRAECWAWCKEREREQELPLIIERSREQAEVAMLANALPDAGRSWCEAAGACTWMDGKKSE
jgi:hypothetical protein